jgi:hypothetical protein
MNTEWNSCCPKHIKGIVCNVENCVHHDSHNCCTASEIAVGPTDAQTSAQTLCVTFRPKTEM